MKLVTFQNIYIVCTEVCLLQKKKTRLLFGQLNITDLLFTDLYIILDECRRR